MNEDRIAYHVGDGKAAFVQLKKHGCIIRAPSPGNQRVRTAKLNGARRGKVGKFTFASRRRLQDALLRLDYKRGFTVSTSFTFPGVEITDEDAKRCFEFWSREAVKRDWSAIWRMEIQQRGMIHYHLWLGIPWSLDTMDMATMKGFFEQIRQSWADAVDSIGCRMSTKTQEKINISQMIGFQKHGVVTEWHSDDEDGSKADFWFRYMAAHAIKDTKQEAVGRGRHWGIVGRKGFSEADTIAEGKLTDAEHAMIMKAYSAEILPEMRERFEKWRGSLPQPISKEDQYKIDRFEQKMVNGLGKVGTWRIFGREIMERLVRIYAPDLFAQGAAPTGSGS